MKFSNIFLGLIVIVFAVSCGEDEKSAESVQEKGVSVEVEEVFPGQYTSFINVVGTIKALNSANLGSQQGGRIEKFYYDKGDRVKKGEVIAELENDVLKANLDAAEAQYELSKTNFERQQQVYEDSVTSEYQFLQAKYNNRQAKANVEQIRAQYDMTFIKAPFDGVIDKKLYEEGEVIPAGGGTPVVSLISTGDVKAEAGVPERYISDVQTGDTVKVKVPSLNDNIFTGRISYVGSSVNSSNRTFPIEVTIPNSENRIKPELLTELAIYNGTFNDVFTIPQEVAVRLDSSFAVYVAENNVASARNIEILKRFGDKMAVRGELASGDSLIIIGYQNLVEGEKVEIEKERNVTE